MGGAARGQKGKVRASPGQRKANTVLPCEVTSAESIMSLLPADQQGSDVCSTHPCFQFILIHKPLTVSNPKLQQQPSQPGPVL